MNPLKSSPDLLMLNTAETAPFEAPWHAQLFATTVYLAQNNHFAWAEWAAHFGDALAKANRSRGALNGGDDYFCVWLDALEAFAIQRGLCRGNRAFHLA